MTEPIWLQNGGVQQFLNLVVDRLDRADADNRSLIRAIRLDRKSFPALYNAEYESEKEQLWGYIEQIASRGWVRIKLDRTQTGKSPYELNPRIEVADEQSIRVAANRITRLKRPNELWRQAVFEHLDASDDVREIVGRFLINIPGRSPQEIVLNMNALRHFADEPLLLREVSARLFWGQSKILDGRQALVAAILEVEECPFPEIPIQLQVFLPLTGFEGVLFIENLATFERATRDSTERFYGLAIVFASGFKGSAKRLRSAGGSALYFAAHGSLDKEARLKIDSWLHKGTDLPCWFWGDLDYSGMAILQTLRSTFVNLQAWEKGYAPMLASLNAGQGHAPDDAGKSAQRPIAITGCEYADSILIPALHDAGRFVDQELG